MCYDFTNLLVSGEVWGGWIAFIDLNLRGRRCLSSPPGYAQNLRFCTWGHLLLKKKINQLKKKLNKWCVPPEDQNRLKRVSGKLRPWRPLPPRLGLLWWSNHPKWSAQTPDTETSPRPHERRLRVLSFMAEPILQTTPLAGSKCFPTRL